MHSNCCCTSEEGQLNQEIHRHDVEKDEDEHENKTHMSVFIGG